MMRFMTILVVLLSGPALFGCQKTNANTTKQQAVKTAGKGKVLAKAGAKKAATSYQCSAHLKVSGMTCQMGCAPFVTKLLKKIKGVGEATVTFKTKSAVVKANGVLCDAKKAQGALDKAFTRIHYKTKLVKIVSAKQGKAAPAKKEKSPVKKAPVAPQKDKKPVKASS